MSKKRIGAGPAAPSEVNDWMPRGSKSGSYSLTLESGLSIPVGLAPCGRTPEPYTASSGCPFWLMS